MTLDIRLLGPHDAPRLERVAPDVFDGPLDPRWCAEFFADPRHHLAVAFDDDTIVGMASAVHYVHPDKAPQLFINEVAVAPTHQGQEVGRRLLNVLFARGRELECTEAWVLADESNAVARRFYERCGGESDEPAIMFTFPLGG